MVFLILFLFLLAGGALAYVTFQNLTDLVSLVIWYWRTPELPSGLWLTGFFLLGASLLYLVSVLSAIPDNRALKALRKRVEELEQEKAQSQVSTSVTAPPSGPLPSAGGNPKTSTGPLPHNSSYMPMPGLPGSPHNKGPLSSSSEYRQ